MFVACPPPAGCLACAKIDVIPRTASRHTCTVLLCPALGLHLGIATDRDMGMSDALRNDSMGSDLASAGRFDLVCRRAFSTPPLFCLQVSGGVSWPGSDFLEREKWAREGL